MQCLANSIYIILSSGVQDHNLVYLVDGGEGGGGRMLT